MTKTRNSDATTAPVVTTVRQKLLLVVFGLGLFVLALALLEGALALFGIGDAYLYEDPYVGFAPGKELFEKQTEPGGEEVYATRPEKLAFFNDQRFPAEKADGAYRIFTLGGSTTAGRPYDDQVAFSRWLDLYLGEMDPSRDWQVVNAGAISYASYRVVLLMKELVRYEPDLFVIYTGHNEFLEERSYSDIIHRNAALKNLQFWLADRRFYALGRRAVSSLGGGEEEATEEDGETLDSEVRTRLDGWTGLELYHRDDELRRQILEHFEYNLDQMIEIARSHGVEVVFVEPISNLKDFSPFKSEHAAGITPEDAASFAALLAEGRSHLAADDAAAAAAAFGRAVELDSEHAEAHFLLGRAHLARGEHDDALTAFVRAKDLDVAPLRALEAISELTREVTSREGVPLVDLPALLADDSRQRLGHAILGNEYLLDHVHPDIPTHSLIAEQVIELLVERGVARADGSWTQGRRLALYDRVVGSIDRAYYAERDLNLSKVLGWAGKLEEAEAPLTRAAAELADNPEVHLNLGIVYQRTGRFEEAVRQLEQAVALDPESAEAHFNLGVVHGRLDHLGEGTAALSRAIRLRPDYVEAHYNLGVLLRRQGKLERAVQSLETAVQLKPDAAESYSHLALALRDLGRFDEAFANFQRALELAPEDASTRTALGVTYGRRDRLDDAVRELRQVIASQPDFAEAHYNLGVVYSQQERGEEALAAFERAVELDPGHVEAYNNLGIIYAGRGEFETARQQLVRAIEADPDYADAYFNLGIVYDSAGFPEEAAQVLQRAVELAPDNPRFHFALAMIQFALGRPEAAREHFVAARAGGIETPAEVAQQLGLRQLGADRDRAGRRPGMR
ncbi:MAG: tetratricopeptide repeat protein [bacterium]|nr:tetratricopeptide repeat protein [bacterium]